MFKRNELSECELITMKCIWDAEGPVSCQEIMEKLRTVYGLDYKDTTVYTFLTKLKQKRFITSFRQDVTYYEAIRCEEEYLNQHLEKALDFWFKGSTVLLMTFLLRMKRISTEEKEALKKMFDEEI